MKSSSQHSFAVAPQVAIPRASFKRNHTYKGTFNAGDLNCVFLDEVLPGDTFNLKLTSFARILSPLKYPIMDNLYMDFQFFFVPIRLVYDDYEKFFGSSKGAEGNWEFDDSHMIPHFNLDDASMHEPADATAVNQAVGVGSLWDHFGLPSSVSLPNDIFLAKVSCLPFRAYNRIVADWYRPSSYELPMPYLNTSSDPDELWNADGEPNYPVQKRLKRCDYFTSALIAPQRGNGIDLPIGDTAPVIGTGKALGLTNGTSEFGLDSQSEKVLQGTTGSLNKDVGGTGHTGSTIPATKILGVSTNPENSQLIADLSSATAVSINSLRQAFQLQRALERDMRGGVRYVSQLLAHFGVRSPDARLQRSEYLGGGSIPVQIHTVASTFGIEGSSRDQASLAAYGVSGQSKVGFIKSFVEHGYVLGIMSVRADLTYQQGIPKLFDRFARFDFYYPVFSHLGEQIVKNKEIFAVSEIGADSSAAIAQNEGVFGYQERYAEYRYGVSKITGQLRSDFAQTLDSWHLAQKFNNLPVLNEEFLQENVPMSRVKAVTDSPDFIYDSLIELNCVRPMPLFGVPGLVDHF